MQFLGWAIQHYARNLMDWSSHRVPHPPTQFCQGRCSDFHFSCNGSALNFSISAKHWEVLLKQTTFTDIFELWVGWQVSVSGKLYDFIHFLWLNEAPVGELQ